MIVTITADFKKAVFTWNEELTECEVSTMNIEDEELEALIDKKAHEGASVSGWQTSIA